MSWSNICRTCLTTNNNLESIHSSPDPLNLDYEYSDSYCKMIQSVTAISIEPNDRLPQEICQKCIHGLLTAFNFQKFTIKTEDALRLLQTPEEPEAPEATVTEEIKNEPSELPKTQKTKIKVKDPSLLLKLDNPPKKKCKTISSDINKKPREIKMKCLQTLQDKPNGQKNKVIVPWVSPPPLISLSKSKITPPPLLLRKIIEHRLQNSELSKQNNEPPKICKYCNLKFVCDFTLKAHLLIHEVDVATTKCCNYCGERPRDILRHLSEHYKFLTCVQCQIKFKTIDHFEIHMANKHNKIIKKIV